MKTLSFITGLCLTTALVVSGAAADTVRVITKENAVREDCRFFAPVKVMVRYGETLQTTSQQGDWYRVQVRGVSGCIHKTAISDRAASISGPMGSARGASRDEAALAGKGFDQQTESAYRSRNAALNYAGVDWVERITIPAERVQNFVTWGGLRQP